MESEGNKVLNEFYTINNGEWRQQNIMCILN